MEPKRPEAKVKPWLIPAVLLCVVALAVLFGLQFLKPGTPTVPGGWPVVLDPVPVISTRGHCADGELAAGHTPYDYTIEGELSGLDPDDPEPYDLLVVIHGFNNSPEKATYKFDLARESLHRNGYNGVLAGFSWDADTQHDPAGATGFNTARRQAELNGPKLARFLLDYRERHSTTRLHLVGYSLGAVVALECLKALEEDPQLDLDRFRVTSVNLLGAAVENEDVELGERYGRAIQLKARRCVNYYSPEDDALTKFYPVQALDRALGAVDIEHPENQPDNYESVDATAELVTFDAAGAEVPADLGDNHSGYLGSRDEAGHLRDDGVLDLVVRDIMKREE